MSRDRDPAHLHPIMLPMLHEHRTRAAGDPAVGAVSIVETARPVVLQNADFARGRDATGNIIDRSAVVTFKRGGDSRHNLTRWVHICPACPHEVRYHIAAPGRPESPRCCSAEGRQLGEGCPCAIGGLRLETGAQWSLVPASLAYHLAPHCRGCHAAGQLVGFGPHSRLSREDLARYRRLGEIGEELGLRWGGNWDGDRCPYESGESDLGHFELASVGTMSQVRAALAIRGGELQWPRTA